MFKVGNVVSIRLEGENADRIGIISNEIGFGSYDFEVRWTIELDGGTVIHQNCPVYKREIRKIER